MTKQQYIKDAFERSQSANLTLEEKEQFIKRLSDGYDEEKLRASQRTNYVRNDWKTILP